MKVKSTLLFEATFQAFNSLDGTSILAFLSLKSFEIVLITTDCGVL